MNIVTKIIASNGIINRPLSEKEMLECLNTLSSNFNEIKRRLNSFGFLIEPITDVDPDTHKAIESA